MERKQRVAKLEALLARVQSRSNRGETHGNAAVAMSQPAAVAAAPVARIAPPTTPAAVQAPPPAASPKSSPVAHAAASAPPAQPARPAVAAHEMQEEVATVVRDVPVEALAAIAAATAQQGQHQKMTPAAGTPAAASPPAAAPAPSVAPAFRGTSAFGGLSKKMTLIGTAPPANWPPRGAETSVPPPEPAPVAAKSEVEEQKSSTPEEDAAPEIQATESEGDLDALLGDEASAPPAAVEEERAPEPAPAIVATSPTTIESKKSELPIVTPDAPLAKKKSRSGSTVIVMIALWLIAMAVIWFVYRKSM